MTQLEAAREGSLTPEIVKAAAREGAQAGLLRAHLPLVTDIARGRTGAAGRDLRMSKARYAFDWDRQFSLSLDPERARRRHSEGLPKNTGDKKFCGMCGPDFCSMRRSRKLGCKAAA